MTLNQIIDAIGVEPYYREDAGVIYNGDCLDILPKMPEKCVDLVVTDPPYMNLKGNMKRNFTGGVSKRINVEKTVGDNWVASIAWMKDAWRICRYGMLVCSSHAGLNDFINAIGNDNLTGIITWYKRNSAPQGKHIPQHNTEYVLLFKKSKGLEWGNIKSTMLDIPMLQAGCMATERILDYSGKTAHPTQKPLQLIKELLVIGGDLIFDPFAGLGTTLLACQELSRRSIGIEIEKKYCDIAVQRLAQEILI